MNRSKERRHIWFVGILLLYCIISITPLLNGMMSPFLPPVLMLLMLFAVFSRESAMLTNGVTVAILAFAALDFLYHLIGVSERIGNAVTHFCCFMSIIVFLFIKDNLGDKEKMFIFYAIVIITAVNIIDNIRLNILHPMASIYAIRYGDSYRGMNIGTTMFNTMTLIVYVICLFLFLNTSKKAGKIFYAGLCVVSVIYMVFFGMRGSVVAIMFVITILMLLVKYVGEYKFLWVFAPLLVIPLFFPDFFFDIIANIVPEGRLVDRLDDIRNVTESGIDDNSFSGRMYYYRVSLETYTKDGISFLFGIGEHIESIETKGQAGTGVGGHSEFIDVLARWGTMGGILVFIIYYKAYKILLVQSHNKLIRNQAKVMFFTLILCGFFKAIFSLSVGIIGFILMPLSVWMIEKENNQI